MTLFHIIRVYKGLKAELYHGSVCAYTNAYKLMVIALVDDTAVVMILLRFPMQNIRYK